MKLSIFTTVTNPEKRGDNVEASLSCYDDLADEIVIVDGGDEPRIVRYDTHHSTVSQKHRTYQIVPWQQWPQEFNWPYIGQSFQKGYEFATGDWVIHCDLDFIFHQRDFAAIRQACKDYANAPALTFYKYQFIQPHKYNLKSRLVLAVNKGKYGDRIRFDSGGDLCQPSLDGKYIEPGTVPESKIPFYNYEKIAKTKSQVMDDVGRMDRAWYGHHGEYVYGSDGTNKSAFDGWMEMMRGRYAKPQQTISLSDHPIYIQETIKNLTPEQFGHDGWGMLQ